MKFKDRQDGGKQLVPALLKYKNNPDAIVLGLPRGGVVPAYEIAKELHVPMDIIVTRKIASPMQPELALGALTQEGVPMFDERVLAMVGVSKEDLAPIVHAETLEAQRRLKLYRGDRAPLDLQNKIAIIVDDGIATGATMRAAIMSARAMGAKKIIVAVPVSPRDTLKKLENEADEIICLHIPDTFWAVGQFYDVFAQTEDEEVIDLMNRYSS